MEKEIIGTQAGLVRPQPKSRLVSIVSILRVVAGMSEGELTVAEVADALVTSDSGMYDGDTMMIYWGGSSGLAEPIIGNPLEEYSGYNERVEIVADLCNAHPWDYPGAATIFVRPYGRTDVKDILVSKDDADKIMLRLWKFFYPNQEQTMDLSRVAEAAGTRRSEEKPGYSTPHLVILNAAIAEFFERRRDRDAKREEVVDWIKSKMTASGMADSDNIAQAIFTIIKRPGHDPKKRRG